MKKFIFYLLLNVFLLTNAKASLIELEKCFSTRFFDAEHAQIKWTQENYFRDSTRIKISKKIWRQNVEKFHEFKNEYGRDKDYYFKSIGIDDYPRIDYVILNTFEYTTKEIENIKSIGGKIINKYDRHVFSVDPDGGLVTEMKVFSDEYFDYVLSYYSELGYGKVNFEMSENDKKIYKNIYKEKKENGPIQFQKFIIDSYAGGLLKAKGEGSQIGYQLIIDFNTLTIKIKTKYDSTYISLRCPDSFADTGSEQGPAGGSGTAFFVSGKGHLLTNNHVVEGCKLSKISYLNKDYDTKLLATDKTLDLALLKAQIKPKSFFNFSKDGAKKLNKIYVAGYPLGKGLSDDLKISSGIVSSLKGFDDNSNEIQIDAPINPGNSGGPIINENGDLVAIAVSGLAKDQTEGINFGIKSSAAENFLKSNKVSPKKSMFLGIKDNEKLLEILEEGTVYTYCN